MLGKLLKYDLKWIYKLVVIFYILAIFFSLLGRFATEFSDNSIIIYVVSRILNGIAIGMFISAIINVFMRGWARFKCNLYGDESYLTHTLPVTKGDIYLSKFLTSVITIFTSVAVAIICLFIMYYSKEVLEIIKNSLELAATIYNGSVVSLVLIISAILFLEILFVSLIGYVGIILGHKASNNKLIKSIGIGFGLYMITQTITLLGIYIFGLFNKGIMDMFTTNNINIESIKLIMYFSILIYLIYIVAYYFIGKKCFEKGVDVD